MMTLLDIIHETHTGLSREDKSRLELVEIRPRSAKFAKVPLSCSIAPNDPADPDKWLDEEMTNPGAAFNVYPGHKYLEMGNGQWYNLRFTIDFTLFFLDMGVGKDEALVLAQTIFKRIHHAILMAGRQRGGLLAKIKGDSYGHHLVRSHNAVKKRQLRPGGSGKKVLYKGKMWLQFETFFEPNKDFETKENP